jgi:hypothetical protein
MTMTHAAVAERQIRTFKRMIADRMRKRPEGERYYHDQAFLDGLTNIYNKTKHATTGMTPIDASKAKNEEEGEGEAGARSPPRAPLPPPRGGRHGEDAGQEANLRQGVRPELEQDDLQDSEDRGGDDLGYHWASSSTS